MCRNASYAAPRSPIVPLCPPKKNATTEHKRTEKGKTKGQLICKIKRAALQHSKPSQCRTFAFVPTHTNKDCNQNLTHTLSYVNQIPTARRVGPNMNFQPVQTLLKCIDVNIMGSEEKLVNERVHVLRRFVF